MLQKQTLAPTTLELLKTLMNDAYLQEFYLVGGTSLALQIGHRISVDLDLFSRAEFNVEQMRYHLENKYGFRTDFFAENTLKGEISGVKIDCITHNYRWLDTFCKEGVRLAGKKDISAMKLNSIAGNGTRIKDFIDLAFLSQFYSLSDMLSFFHEKYNANELIPLKAVTFFDEINQNEPIKLTNGEKMNWKNIAKRINLMSKNISKVFPEPPL